MVREGASSVYRNPSRGVVALLLFVLLGAGSLGVIGHVQAEDHILPGEPVELDTLVLPEPRVGDHWTYQRIDTRTGELRPDAAVIHRKWLPPIPLVDADRVGWMAPRVAEKWSTDDTRHVTAHAVRPSDGTIIATHHLDAGSGGSPSMIFDVDYADHFETTMPWTPGQTTPCELAPHLDGSQPQMTRPFMVPPCLAPGIGIHRATEMRAIGAYEKGGHTYAVFGSDMREGIERIVFRTDLPVPTLIVQQLGDARKAIALTGFTAGDTPLLQGRTAMYTLPALAFAPIEPWGLNDTGTDHPYPLSSAWKDVWEDDSSGLKRYLADQPDARTHDMRFQEQVDDEATVWSWDWSVGGESYCATRTERHGPHATVDAVRQALPQQEEEETCSLGGARNEPSGLATTGPTVKSLQDAWRVYARAHGLPEGPIFWSIDGQTTGEPQYRVGVVWYEVEPGETPLNNERQDYHHASIVFANSGEVVRTNRDTMGWSFDLIGEGTPPDSSEQLSPAEAGPTRPVPLWVAPALEDGIYATLAALAIALLYWLFPHLKQGILAPLFSRITRHTALDHEVRAAILAAVEAEPGIHDRELQRRLGLARGQLRHHLEKLIETGLLTRKKAGGFTGYWAPGNPPTRDAEQAAVLRAPLAQEIHALLQAEPHLSAVALASRLGRSRQSISYHVGRLRRAGLLPS